MHCGCFCCHQRLSPWESWREAPERARMSSRNKKHSDNISPDKGRCISLCRDSMETSLPSPSPSVTLPGLRLPASASLPLASCWPRPQQLLPVSATGGGRRRCSQRERLWHTGPLSTGRPRPNMAQKGGPCFRGQALLNKRTLSSCRESRQRSTAVSDTSYFIRPALARPTRQWLPLWGSCRASG